MSEPEDRDTSHIREAYREQIEWLAERLETDPGGVTIHPHADGYTLHFPLELDLGDEHPGPMDVVNEYAAVFRAPDLFGVGPGRVGVRVDSPSRAVVLVQDVTVA